MILVDSRRGSHELVAPLTAMGLPVEETTLDYGDLLFTGRGEDGVPVTVAVEYKKLSELVTSLRTGRLQDHQALGMQTYDYRWLLIEGELIYGKDGKLLRRKGRRAFTGVGGMTVGELFKRLLVLQLMMGLIPALTRYRRDSLKFIEALYRTWTDTDLDKHKSHLAIHQPTTVRPISGFRRAVMMWPGIGLEISRAAERAFQGSVEAAAAADIETWSRVAVVEGSPDGGDIRHFGRIKAEKLVAFLKGDAHGKHIPR